jgi:DNA-binding MarR family transcriptional regulator
MTRPKSRDDPDRRIEDQPADLEACVAGLVNAVDKGMAKEVAPYGLTSLDFSLLKVCLEKESTATQLAQVLPVDGARISRIVTGLVDKGLLRRRRLRNDRRIVMLRLSEEGRELTSVVLQKMKRYDTMLTEGIGEEEMRVFVSVTARIIANHAATSEV